MAAASSPLHRPLVAGALLVAAIVLAYANSLRGPFVFDDIASIAENPTIRDLASAAIWSPPPGVTVSGRPLVNASLALDRALGGENVRGYHVTNLAIHALAALVLFGLLRRTFSLSGCGWMPQNHRLEADATWTAFIAALLWALHPLQTESVTYIIQRAESLMGLLYLLTLYCFVRGLDVVATGSSRGNEAGASLLTSAATKTLWSALSVFACALGMATKEVMVSAPLAVLLYDRTFAAGSFAAAWRQRGRFHLALAATWLVLALVLGARPGTSAPSWAYALTQCSAVAHYLRLAAWPHPLVFDYGPNVAPGPWAAGLGVVIVAALAIVAVRGSLQRRAVGFAVASFLLLLAPTSLVPIVTEPMAEHRMYLPLAALAALAAAGLRRLGPAPFVIVTLGLGGLTFLRNETYRTARTLWTATVHAAPQNPRAHYSLGLALVADGEPAAAESHLRTALALQPNYVGARHALAELLANQQRGPEATMELETILRAHPDDFVAHQALGTLAFQRGDLATAVRHFGAALRVQPDSAAAHNNLGCAHYALGDFAAARTHAEAALRLNPNYAEAHFNLGNALTRQGELAAARAAYERALRLAPGYAEAHAHLGVVCQNLGDAETAIRHYREALRLRPDLAFVRQNLEALLVAPRRP